MGKKWDKARDSIVDTIANKIGQGGMEMMSFFYGGSPFAQYSDSGFPKSQEQAHGVHGPPSGPDAAAVAPPAHHADPPEVLHLQHQALQRQVHENWFQKEAAHQREASPHRTQAQRESVLDSFQAMQQATKESYAERGVHPPDWTALSRDDLSQSFTPQEPAHLQRAREAVAYQVAKEGLAKGAAVDKALAGMKPHEQAIAASFREAPQSQWTPPSAIEKAQKAAMEAPKGRSRSIEL